MLFSKPKKAIGIDIGAHCVKAVQMSRSGRRLHVDGTGMALVDRNLVNTDPVAAHAMAVRDALRTIFLAQSLVVGALPGQTVVIRYPRLPDMPEDRIGAAIEKEASQHIPYDLSEVFLDWSLLERVTEGNDRLLKVLLVAARHEVIDSRVQIASAAEIQYGILTVDSLALADAAECCGFLQPGETVALVNIGLTSASIHFVKDGISNFIRDINWGSREFIQSIVRARRCDYEQAEKLLCTAAEESESKPETPRTAPETEEQKPASNASLLDPFEDEFEMAPKTPAPAAAMPDSDKPVQDLLGTPLNKLVSELRRSLDFYEHELYETPIDRMILSGGVAHLPIIRATLEEELALKRVDVANPTDSALTFGDGSATGALYEHPAQFMVAIGLAARGMAEL
mgnify:FL=1